MTIPAVEQSGAGPLTPEDLIVYLRLSEANLHMPALTQIVDLTNGLLHDVTGALTTGSAARALPVLLEVAARAYRNPEGVSETKTGPFSKRVSVAERLGVYLTDSERQDLLGMALPAVDSAWSGSRPYRR